MERVLSNTKLGEFWDNGVDALGSGLENAALSVLPASFSIDRSSRG